MLLRQTYVFRRTLETHSPGRGIRRSLGPSKDDSSSDSHRRKTSPESTRADSNKKQKESLPPKGQVEEERAEKKKERAARKKMRAWMTDLEPCDNSLSFTRTPSKARRMETNLEVILKEESTEFLFQQSPLEQNGKDLPNLPKRASIYRALKLLRLGARHSRGLWIVPCGPLSSGDGRDDSKA